MQDPDEPGLARTAHGAIPALDRPRGRLNLPRLPRDG